MDLGQSFQRKIYGLNGFDTFFAHFPTIFFFSPVFDVVSIVIRLIVMSYRLHMHENYRFLSNRRTTERIYCLPLKAIGFNDD